MTVMVAPQLGSTSYPGARERSPIAPDAFTVEVGGEVRLVGQRCRRCGACFFPGGRDRCGRCFGGDLERVELEGRGRLDCYTVVRQAPKGYFGPVPYVVGSVTVGSEVQVIAQLVGKDPETWCCGEVVAVCTYEVPRDAHGERIAVCYGFGPTGEPGASLVAAR